MMNCNIMIVGVGGQGSLLASRLLGNLFVGEGCDVKLSEVHGMSQRGGSVVTYVRAGDVVFSPLIERGEADIILSFEKLEALRYSEYLKEGGVVVTGTREIDPMSVTVGSAVYPDNVLETLRAEGIEVDAIDATGIAEAAGSPKAENVALIGRLSRRFDIPVERWLRAVEESVPPKALEVNKKAFLAGRGE